MKYIPFSLSLLATITLTACSETSVDVSQELPDESPAVQARLKSLGTSVAFFEALEDALINQGGSYNTDVVTDAQMESAPVEAPMAPESSADSADSSTAGAAGNEVTSTNVQEVGVDEQDRVKVNAAGTQLFVLHSEYPEFEQPGAPPVPESSEITVEPDGIPTDQPYQNLTTLRILTLDPETPDATGVKDLPIDLQGRTADGFYLYENSDESSVVITSSGGGYWGYWGEPTAFSDLQSTIAKVDVQDAANAAVTDMFTLDGQIISSRRIGDSLFFASRYYPAIPGVDPWEQDSDQWRDTVESADLAELMPEYSRNGSEEVTPLVDASTCFVAPVSTTQPYYSPDIITLGVIDLATMQLRDAECFLGATETLYASTESVFLATTQYAYDVGPATTDGIAVDVQVDVFEPDMEWSDPRSSTDIHQFDIRDGQLNYSGSGSVSGHLGWNELQKPFRMSERGEYLRVATMNDQQGPEHSPILLNVLALDGEGDMQTVASLPNDSRPKHIGEPGEQLYASRYVGDMAYMVTFRQTDPLYVIDLSNPSDPEVKGELKIDGYSDYLQPVDENLLLGIGKDAVPATDDPQVVRGGGVGDGRGAWVQGIKLALFDVSDPTAPSEVQSVIVGERGTHSVALGNHRAITVQPATELHPMRVSFGIDVYGEPMPGSLPSQDEAFNYAQWNYTGLHGFDVVAGANASIVPKGALIVDRANGVDRYYAGFGDDRSVMVNDAVFYINGSKVYPALWDNLDVEPLAR